MLIIMSYYGKYEAVLESTRREFLDYLGGFTHEHLEARIKRPESVEEKLKRKSLKPGIDSAMNELTDILGFRLIVRFLSDIDECVAKVRAEQDVVLIKDYVKDPKPNGYRSVHIIIRKNGVYLELQIRTIAQDCWAALEHELKYKKHRSSEELITRELNRCADELAAADITMDTIKNKLI